jgi:hypothetical protein
VDDQNKEEHRLGCETGTVPFILFLCMRHLVLFRVPRISLTVSLPRVHPDHPKSYWGLEVLLWPQCQDHEQNVKIGECRSILGSRQRRAGTLVRGRMLTTHLPCWNWQVKLTFL